MGQCGSAKVTVEMSVNKIYCPHVSHHLYSLCHTICLSRALELFPRQKRFGLSTTTYGQTDTGFAIEHFSFGAGNIGFWVKEFDSEVLKLCWAKTFLWDDTLFLVCS